MGLAHLPEPPYTVVVFTSQLRENLGRADLDAYDAAAERMEELAAAQPGYLGIESARGTDGVGLTASYWIDDNAARDWKHLAEHLDAQRTGRRDWYAAYEVRVATVTRAYGHGPVGRTATGQPAGPPT